MNYYIGLQFVIRVLLDMRGMSVLSSTPLIFSSPLDFLVMDTTLQVSSCKYITHHEQDILKLH
jgi:hypothetical protein